MAHSACQESCAWRSSASPSALRTAASIDGFQIVGGFQPEPAGGPRRDGPAKRQHQLVLLGDNLGARRLRQHHFEPVAGDQGRLASVPRQIVPLAAQLRFQRDRGGRPVSADHADHVQALVPHLHGKCGLFKIEYVPVERRHHKWIAALEQALRAGLERRIPAAVHAQRFDLHRAIELTAEPEGRIERLPFEAPLRPTKIPFHLDDSLVAARRQSNRAVGILVGELVCDVKWLRGQCAEQRDERKNRDLHRLPL